MAVGYYNSHAHLGSGGYYVASSSGSGNIGTIVDSTVRIPKGAIVEGYVRYNDCTNMMEVYANGQWNNIAHVDKVESLQDRHARIMKELAEFWPDAYFDLGMKGLL